MFYGKTRCKKHSIRATIVKSTFRRFAHAYGIKMEAKKAVVVTDGEISSVIKMGKMVFVIANQEQLFNELSKLIENDAIRIRFGELLYKYNCRKLFKSKECKNYTDWLQTI
jgi:hypothetical protein